MAVAQADSFAPGPEVEGGQFRLLRLGVPEGGKLGAVVLLNALQKHRALRVEVGILHARQVEGFADGVAGDAVLHHRLILQGREGDIAMALADKVAVDLVGEHDDLMLQGEAPEAQ